MIGNLAYGREWLFYLGWNYLFTTFYEDGDEDENEDLIPILFSYRLIETSDTETIRIRLLLLFYLDIYFMLICKCRIRVPHCVLHFFFGLLVCLNLRFPFCSVMLV